MGKVLERVQSGYEGERRKLVVRVDNKGVVERLRKNRGLCGEGRKRVRKWGKILLERGWVVRIEWVPGHVGIYENEEADERASEGVWNEEGKGEMEDIVVMGRWEERRKKTEWKIWREYWEKERKSEEYFGRGERGGERGHEGSRWFSRFLL